MISDPTTGQKDGPTKAIDPGDSHSGEGLASVRPRLARTLADAERQNRDRQMEAMTSRTPIETPPEPDSEFPAP